MNGDAHFINVCAGITCRPSIGGGERYAESLRTYVRGRPIFTPEVFWPAVRDPGEVSIPSARRSTLSFPEPPILDEPQGVVRHGALTCPAHIDGDPANGCFVRHF